MKIIEMERRTLDGKPIEQDALKENTEDYRDWWCVIETKEEEVFYDMAFNGVKPLRMSEKDMPTDTLKIVWDDLVCYAGAGLGVSWGDDDMYGYIRPDEEVPEVGEETIDGDGDRWVRLY